MLWPTVACAVLACASLSQVSAAAPATTGGEAGLVAALVGALDAERRFALELALGGDDSESLSAVLLAAREALRDKVSSATSEAAHPPEASPGDEQAEGEGRSEVVVERTAPIVEAGAPPARPATAEGKPADAGEAESGEAVEVQPQPPLAGNAEDVEVEAGEVSEGCGRAYMAKINLWIRASGFPLAKDPLETLGDPRHHAVAFTECSEAGGKLALLQLDLPGFLRRVEAMISPKRAPVEALRLLEFEQRQAQNGLGICVPTSCLIPDLGSIALTYFTCISDRACQGVEDFPDQPIEGLELNSSWVTGPACGEALEMRALAGEVLGGVPWWLFCPPDTPGHEEWHDWGIMLGSSLVSWPATGPSKEVAREADRLAEEHLKPAEQWCNFVLGLTGAVCGAEHQEFEPGRPRPEHWQGAESWKYELGFCPLGYASTLIVRAAARHAVGLFASVAEDLRKLRAVLGSCDDPAWDGLVRCAASLDFQLVAGAAGSGQLPQATVPCPDELLWHGLSLLQKAPPLLVQTC